MPGHRPDRIGEETRGESSRRLPRDDEGFGVRGCHLVNQAAQAVGTGRKRSVSLHIRPEDKIAGGEGRAIVPDEPAMQEVAGLKASVREERGSPPRRTEPLGPDGARRRWLRDRGQEAPRGRSPGTRLHRPQKGPGAGRRVRTPLSVFGEVGRRPVGWSRKRARRWTDPRKLPAPWQAPPAEQTSRNGGLAFGYPCRSTKNAPASRLAWQLHEPPHPF